jgi:hypothetical protein
MQLKDAPAGPDGGSRKSGDMIPIRHRKCHCLFAAMGMLSPNYSPAELQSGQDSLTITV